MAKTINRHRRRRRVRSKLRSVTSRLRLTVFRSNCYFYGQIIDDQKRKTLVSVCEKELAKGKKRKIDRAGLLGELLAKKAKTAKIKEVVFDRGAYRYHGRVKAFAEGARKGGLKL